MKPFVVNRHGRLVFPANFFVELDFSSFKSLDQFTAVIERDFESKAPTGTDILQRAESGAYGNRFELLRDLGLHLFWLNRYSLTMYEKRPTRWRDVPRTRDDVFIPVLQPWEEGERKVAGVEGAYRVLSPCWEEAVEDRIFELLFDVFRHKRHHGTELPAIKPTVAAFLAEPDNCTFVLGDHDPDYPVFQSHDIVDCSEAVPELEALMRWAMVLHNQYPWSRAETRLGEAGKIGDHDFVVLFYPRNREVLEFIRRVKAGAAPGRIRPQVEARPPCRPYPAVQVRQRFATMPRFEALAVVKGEHICSNADLIRNAAFNWSPMTADEIRAKTGIEQRLYTEKGLEEIAFEAAEAALDKAGRGREEIGAVIFCSCTSTRLIPSVATWLSGELGMLQTHASVDLIAACAGFPYGLAEATRLLQEVERPVLLVCAEKFSDKIGSVRTSRMIFGDGAAAVVVGPAPPDEPPDIEVVQTYASGPVSEVNSIIWPNPEFDNNITVYGPQVKALVERYLAQMMGELAELPDPDETKGSLLETIELIVPHQANKTMIMKLAGGAGIPGDRLYFNIERVGNVSAASIPIAIYDAVEDGVINRPTRLFAPGFGAGAVGGYAVLRIDPAVVAPEAHMREPHSPGWPTPTRGASSSEDVRVAFGE